MMAARLEKEACPVCGAIKATGAVKVHVKRKHGLATGVGGV